LTSDCNSATPPDRLKEPLLSKRRASPAKAPAAAATADPDHNQDDGDGNGDDGDERPSRSARKRAAEALQKLGVGLTRLRPAQLRQLPLPETLLEAILEAQRLRSRVALARQRQYIGRLMREVDAEPIERALASVLAHR
jgi:ribosomal 50S subunit-associated protein YjgA (DUF615 family)